MVIAVWSVKGGAGVTSVAVMLALGAQARAEPALVVDLCGDAPAVLGSADTPGAPGVAEWLGSHAQDPSALSRLEVRAGVDLGIIGRGAGPLVGDASTLIRALHQRTGTVVVDCGLVGAADHFTRDIISQAACSVLVLRRCFLSLRAAQACTLQADGVIVLDEPGRCFNRADIEASTGASVIANVAVDSAIANRIDAGLLRSPLPRRLVRTMSKVVQNVHA